MAVLRGAISCVEDGHRPSLQGGSTDLTWRGRGAEIFAAQQRRQSWL